MKFESIQQIPNIAKALGPIRLRDEFIPYLEYLLDENDEILLELSN